MLNQVDGVRSILGEFSGIGEFAEAQSEKFALVFKKSSNTLKKFILHADDLW